MTKTNTKVSIINNNKSSSKLINIKQRSKETSHQCKICGDSALNSNFGVTTCSPCKMFFKRNAETGQRHLTCRFGRNCQINIHNRHICSFCRLAKCFANGMQTELIRCSTSKKNTTKQTKKVINQPITTISNNTLFPTLNLLQTNQTILTIDQSNLFSNLMLCYDEHSELLLAERFIFQQNILPIKLRFKYGHVSEFLLSLFNKAQSLFKKNRDFLSLNSHDRSILLRHQIKYITILSSSFIIQQSHLLEYPAFYKAIETLFGRIIIATNKHSIDLLSFDIPFLKLALAIICFSSFDYTIYENIPTKNLTNIKTIIQIQNMYIELAWRYLVYVYDVKQAIICFSNLIRCILTVNNALILMQDKTNFTDMIDSVIERTEQAFILVSE